MATTNKVSIKLTIGNRLFLYSLLPSKGDYRTLRIAKGLHDRVAPTVAQLEHVNYEVMDNGQVRWEDPEEVEVGYEFTVFEVEFIANRLKEINDAQELQLHHLPFWEKFVEVE